MKTVEKKKDPELALILTKIRLLGEDEAYDVMESYAKQHEPFPNFYKRLRNFVSNVQVNDPMSEEEKEMIIHICDKHTKNKKG